MRRVVLAALLLAGCGKRINPAWCQLPENQSDSECPANIEDAAVVTTACSNDNDCASDPIGKLCNAGVCVVCRDSGDCMDVAAPVCTNNVCLPCQHDLECGNSANAYCQDGQCEQATMAYFASPGGSGAMCSEALPCDLPTGVQTAITNHKVLRLVGDSTGVTFHLAAPLTLSQDVRISGVSTSTLAQRIILDGGGRTDAIVVSGGQVTLDDVYITGAKGSAIDCTGGTFVARRLWIHDLQDDDDTKNAALRSSASCALTLDASVVSGNKHGAIDVSGASGTPFEVSNSVFFGNDGGPAVLLHGNGRFEYDTVVENHAVSGTSGVSCTNAGGVRLDMNILVNNKLDNPPTKSNGNNKPPSVLPAPQFDGCDTEHGFTYDSVDMQFAGGDDPFTAHALTRMTPIYPVNISNVSCQGMLDIDQQARPAHSRCDMGADECADCTQFSPINLGYNYQDPNPGH